MWRRPNHAAYQRLKKPSLVVCSAPKNGTSVPNKSRLQVSSMGGREISDIHIFRLAFFFLAVQSSQIMEGVQSYSFTKVKNTVIDVETISLLSYVNSHAIVFQPDIPRSPCFLYLYLMNV